MNRYDFGHCSVSAVICIPFHGNIELFLFFAEALKPFFQGKKYRPDDLVSQWEPTKESHLKY